MVYSGKFANFGASSEGDDDFDESRSSFACIVSDRFDLLDLDPVTRLQLSCRLDLLEICTGIRNHSRFDLILEFGASALLNSPFFKFDISFLVFFQLSLQFLHSMVLLFLLLTLVHRGSQE